MNAPVNVLAVLQTWADDACAPLMPRAERQAVLAAAVELIDADAEYDSALSAFEQLTRQVAESGWIELEHDALRNASLRFAAAKLRRADAHARCKGGAASSARKGQVAAAHSRQAAIESIAVRVLGLETLEIRRSDAADFHDLAVWQIRAALEAAYDAGCKAKVPS